MRGTVVPSTACSAFIHALAIESTHPEKPLAITVAVFNVIQWLSIAGAPVIQVLLGITSFVIVYLGIFNP